MKKGAPDSLRINMAEYINDPTLIIKEKEAPGYFQGPF